MRAEKSLGQHFLRDTRVLEDIAAITDVAHSDGCLEIGPGEGALTAFLVSSGKGKPIVAIDPDPRAIAAVTQRFGGEVRAVLGDATKDDLAALLPGPRSVVVGNLPYNAASLIHRRVLALGTRVSRAVLMFQKEVALRLVAVPKTRDYGIPSIVTQVAATAYIVREVGPECFAPRPKVDSAVVLVEPRPEPLVAVSELEVFGDFLAKAFQQRRKTLGNALGERRSLLEVVGIDPTRRAEELSVEEWVALYRVSSRTSE
ncbi:MAG TPA: 16S rRNA (adenine(1518)-N(6)/adenine(1519)-N(6))-dimethyltransferase RsmA [Myxococcota bacterium]|nr:16S rRNA (adenine(1518)-N(6)/adenine(1519)-N(6))-dimethyltransferase RsmA [Myxococcota bacterium]